MGTASTDAHASRLGVRTNAQHANGSLQQPKPRVAIIGAGLSGLICARTLADHGFNVTVFEKSRGVGGRMATRRTDEGAHFDHGAQYFTVRDQRFERFVQAWIQDRIVAEWEGRVGSLDSGEWQLKANSVKRYVATPSMNAICRHLAQDLSIAFCTRVGVPELESGKWRVNDADGRFLGEFDCFLSSAPAPQAAELLAAAPALQQRIARQSMSGCWAVMVHFDQSLELPFVGAFVQTSPLSWIARNTSKPHRPAAGESWVLHSTPSWADQHMEADSVVVQRQLIHAFWQAIDRDPVEASYVASHRWRFALPREPLEEGALFDASLRVGACGDWCSGARVEGAFLSGTALAGQVLTDLVG